MAEKSGLVGLGEALQGHFGYVFDNFGVAMVVVWRKIC